jgi:HEAT repeat protein
MEEVFQRMRALATAAVPLLDELASSPLPGDRLGAVAILQVFASSEHLPFLVERVGTERPFVGYHAAKALAFAVEAVDPGTYPSLRQALENGRNALRSAAAGMDSDRAKVMERALADLSAAEKFLVEGK